MDDQIVNQKSNQELTDEKFEACTSFSLEELCTILSPGAIQKYGQSFNFDKFSALLKEYRLEEFSEHLFYYMILRHKFFKGSDSNGEAKYHEKLIKQEQLVNTLSLLASRNKISCIKIYNPATFEINDDETISVIAKSAIDSLWERIVDLKLNLFPLTGDEAINAINNQEDKEWLKDWMESLGYVDPDYETFTLDKFDDYFEALGFRNIIPDIKKQVRQQLISEYSYDHPTELPFSEESICTIIKEIKARKPGPGRKEDTLRLKRIAYELSVLVRIDRYLSDTGKKRISETPLKNEDCRAIHDILVFWRLQKNYREYSKNEKNLEKLIRKMVQSYNECSGIQDIDERLLCLKHDFSI